MSEKFLRLISSALIFVFLTQTCFGTAAPADSEDPLTAEAAQCADILGIRAEVNRIISLGRNGASSAELNELRAYSLRKILHGVIQVQLAESRLEMEMAYTYDVMDRNQRQMNTVNQFFNIANFLQFSALYTTEPFLRIHKKFVQSATLTTIGGGIGLVLPILNILYNKTAEAHNLKPPEYLSHLITGSPVDGSNLPQFVARYMDTASPGSQSTRRDELNALWNKRYHADMQKEETLCGINDGHAKKIFVLQSRIVLLWSLYTAIQAFDRELLALVNQISDYHADVLPERSADKTVIGLTGQADDAARLLHLEPVVSELKSLEAGNSSSERRTELQVALMERLLSGYLDMRIAADKCQEELNYQYDVVLAQMNARRGKFLQKTYEANFIQTNTLGSIAGLKYLQGNTRAGNELFAVANSVGIGITTVSLLATQGGWRKNQAAPNSLADLFDLQAPGRYGFSTPVWNFLNSSGPDTGGKTRRERLMDYWYTNAVTNMDIKQRRNQEKLASMPSCRYDTINLVTNRIALISALREELGRFDVELLDLLRQTWPENFVPAAEPPGKDAYVPARIAAKLLGVEPLVEEAHQNRASNQEMIVFTRRVLEGFLQAGSDADMLGSEIQRENHVMARMIRERDKVIQLTNIVNFYQIGILGVIFDGLGLSTNSREVLAGNQINIISGIMVGALAITALLERHGGLRPTQAPPNILANMFNLKTDHEPLSPLMSTFLDSPSPSFMTGYTRRQVLTKYWKEGKNLTVSIKPKSNQEKLGAEGIAHHWWCETIKLIDNRICMLWDLRAVLRNSNVLFDALLSDVN
jgi:hypothetical protein